MGTHVRTKLLVVMLILAAALLFPVQGLSPLVSTAKAAGNIVINGIDIGYANGSYFTKNGRSCEDSYWPANANGVHRCHKQGVCEDATHPHCNCMRYWPSIENCQVDLMSSQCYAFARYCEWRVYGHHDGQSGYFKTYAVNQGKVSTATLKNLLLGCLPATHVRLEKGVGHSISIVSTSDSGVYYVDCNTDGLCKVREYNVTWEQLTNTINGYSGITSINTWRDGNIPVVPVINDDIVIHNENGNDVVNPTVTTTDYIVHIDSPSGTYNGQGDIEISGWVASRIALTSVMAQSDALAAGQINLTSGTVDASEELNNAGYSAYAYKKRFRGVIPGSGLSNRTYSFSVWMDLATGGQTKVTTSTFTVRNGGGSSGGGSSGGSVPVTNPAAVDAVVHIDAPTGSYTDNDVEISGWIASMKPIGSCMVESEAIPQRQYNLTSSLVDASAELNGAGYGAYPYKYRYSGAIPKHGMASNRDYEFKVWFNYADGSSSGVTTSTFHTNAMKNTEIVISTPKGGSNYANNSNVPITGYILSNSELWYILCQVGDHQYSLEGTDNATLASSNGYAHAYKFSKTIRCDTLTPNSRPTLEVWTKNAGDGVEVHKQVQFTTGARVYGSLDDFQSVNDAPTNGMTATGDFEVRGWIAAHAPIAYVMCQAVPTDGTGGFQMSLDIEPTSELDSGYSNYEYRARYRGIIEYGKLKSNKTYTFTIWCGLVDSSGNGNQKFLPGCDKTFKTNTVTKPVYTNTFNANGGSGAPAAVSKTWGTAITLPATVPTRLGYTFLGWSFNKDAYEPKYLPGATFKEETSHTLYAVWEPARLIPVDLTRSTQTVTVAFGGQKIAYRIVPNKTTRYQIKAVGGAVSVYDAQGAAVTIYPDFGAMMQAGQPYTIVAGFASATQTGSFPMTILRGYPVLFNANGGVGAPEGEYYQYYDEEMDIPPQEPTREVSVTLDANGGTVGVSSRAIEKEFRVRAVSGGEDTTLTYSAGFNGWSSDDAYYVVDEEHIYNTDTTLYASWAFPSIGALAEVQRTGYDLKYWVDEEFNQVGEDYVALDGTTLHAVWEPVQYTIRYNVNGGAGSVADTIKTHGVTATLTTAVPTREGYTFKGWATSSSAVTPAYASGADYTGNANRTLYAVWESNRIPVTSFTFAENELSVSANETLQLVPLFEPANATDTSVTWSSLKPSVATVDAQGLVTGVSEGTAMIKAVCNDNGAIAYVRITVTKANDLRLPAALTSIGEEAFMGDTSIKVAVIGNQVKSIGSRAFKNCTAMTEIHIPSSVTTIATDAFDGCPDLVIYCQEGSTAWETALLKGIDWIVE